MSAQEWTLADGRVVKDTVQGKPVEHPKNGSAPPRVARPFSTRTMAGTPRRETGMRAIWKHFKAWSGPTSFVLVVLLWLASRNALSDITEQTGTEVSFNPFSGLGFVGDYFGEAVSLFGDVNGQTWLIVILAIVVLLLIVLLVRTRRQSATPRR